MPLSSLSTRSLPIQMLHWPPRYTSLRLISFLLGKVKQKLVLSLDLVSTRILLLPPRGERRREKCIGHLQKNVACYSGAP
uniref:Uncharacterized protein n=1 Tax=Steinernema glaseri TaxID=37863 RepID=A0A1I7XY93_9BILA